MKLINNKNVLLKRVPSDSSYNMEPVKYEVVESGEKSTLSPGDIVIYLDMESSFIYDNEYYYVVEEEKLFVKI